MGGATMPESRQDGQDPIDRAVLFRYQVVALVLSRETLGEVRARAVKAAARTPHWDCWGRQQKVSERSIYRWVKAYERRGLDGLKPKPRAKTGSSVVLEAELLAYLKAQKAEDPHASIPELLKRAALEGLIETREAVDRSTVWRALRRMGVATKRTKVGKQTRCRRFAFPHRLDLVLCDGKHFRAGLTNRKRVALFFIDDATRLVLAVVVGPSENTALFLRGLYKCLSNYGLMRRLYMDNGSGFTSAESKRVMANLGLHFIFGTAGYPEGHGKIERFNQTVWNALLYRFAGNQTIDPDCARLELRLEHYVREIYNHEAHEGLGGETPWSRFHKDPVPLRFPQNTARLVEAFVIPYQRTVSKDHIAGLEGTCYEVPQGYARRPILLHHNLLTDAVGMLHQGRMIELAPVDLQRNAHRGPGAGKPAEKSELHIANLPTSAEMAFDRAMPPLVDKQGNYARWEEKDE